MVNYAIGSSPNTDRSSLTDCETGNGGGIYDGPLQETTEADTRAVEQCQKWLKEQGYYNGNIDGMWGPKNQQAFDQAIRERGEEFWMQDCPPEIKEHFGHAQKRGITGFGKTPDAATECILPDNGEGGFGIKAEDAVLPDLRTFDPDVTEEQTMLAEKNPATIVQNFLNESGYNSGPADGIVGPKTRAALEEYLTNNGGNWRSPNVPDFVQEALNTLIKQGTFKPAEMPEIGGLVEAEPARMPGVEGGVNGAVPMPEINVPSRFCSGNTEGLCFAGDPVVLKAFADALGTGMYAEFIPPGRTSPDAPEHSQSYSSFPTLSSSMA